MYDLKLTDQEVLRTHGYPCQKVETAGGIYLGIVIEIPGGWTWTPSVPTDVGEPDLRTTAEDAAQDLATWMLDHDDDVRRELEPGRFGT
jgi:hypothetical protein